MKERNRARKKQKRLDAICEKVYNSNRLNHAESKAESNEGDAGMESGEKEGELRRSSRVRKAPEVLDSSPLRLRKRQRGDESRVNLSKKNDGKRNEDGLDKEKEKEKEKEKTTKSLGVKFGDGEGKGGWKSRLRSRANEGSSEGKETLTPRRLLLAFDDSDGVKGESKDAKKEEIEGSKQCELDGVKEESKKEVEGSKRGVSGKIKRSAGSLDRNIKGNEVNVGDEVLHLAEGGNLHSKVSPVDGSEDTIANDSAIQVVEKEEGKMMENDGEVLEQRDKQIEQAVCEKEKEDCMGGVEKVGTVMDEAGNGGSSADKDACPGEVDKDACPDEVEKDACSTEVDKGACLAEVDRVAGPAEVGRKLLEDRDVVKMDNIKSVSTDRFHKSRVREGRRCGLCGRGNDGRPPKRLVKDFVDSDNEGYGESSSEEANYDMWDGFGDESGWMGRLLGPIHDRFGIAGVWVHQQCAVWSPEVYFAGLGCLKNVRAALFRGRALKCSRCGRPGATIGCRVDRCPRTFHLPCARSDSCVFDHRKFLIACGDHRHIFQPHGNQYLHRIKKLKNKKLKLEMKKRSDDAWRNDFEAEEKWLEKCGEDEEFLKREGKRLHRDILRIAPVYIGGSSGNSEKLCQGWESVAGLQDVVQCMKEVVLLPLLYPEFFSSLGLTPPRGVLLHGYPGTGKTLVVRALIGSCARGDRRIAYFARKGADCLGKYVGDAERQLRLLFQVAEKSQPSIIFFDEIDGLAPCRTRQQDQTHNSVVSTLLALMDGLKSRGSVIVIGATNRPDAIDPALRRPGRFDREIYFPLPSVEDRAAILSVHTQKWPRPVSGSFLKLVAQKTAGFAGADLQALCTQAAMTALRRNCDLQKIMSIAEKRAGNGCHLPLSSFPVKEKDWLDALACAPPPCSRREAGMAVNDVASSPLHLHLVPCLLQPLSHLLVSLYCDERVFLPPFLYKAAKVIKSAIISALEKIGKSDDFWWSYLPDFVKEADTVKQIETGLSSTGLLVGESVYSNSYAPNDDTDAGKGSELHKVIRPGTSSRFAKNGPYLSGRTSGFRALIAGHPKSGQRHLASCILYGFVGCVEIQKIDLATLSQEGHGDVIEGMTRILLKCLNKDLCVIYMPRIDLWAMEMLPEVDEMEYDISEDKRKSDDTTGQTDVKRIISELWNAFMEQVDSTHLSASLTILATSEVPSQGIPHRICQFFSSDVLKDSDSTPSQHALPRFVVQTDGNLDCDTVINSSAIELSHSLVQQYVQLVHDRTHADNILKEYRAGDVHGGNAEAESHNNCVGSDISNDDAFGDGDKAQLHTKGDDQCLPISKTANHQDDEVLCDPQEAGRRALPDNKTVKGKSSLFLAIYSFGYQVLLYPHFSELCWATSKLRDGPCTDISGPWKGWPFNSCIIRSNNSEKVAIGLSSASLNNKEHSGVVRGLTAVGLLAYRGVYTSVREVAFEVRKVLELLAGHVSTKIIGGKDSHRFHRLLSQMAYLEDMVNSWAYTLQSLERDNVVTFLNPKERVVDHPGNQHPPECTPAGSDVCRPNISLKNSNELEKHEKSPPIFADSSEFATSNKNVAHLSLPESEARIVVSESAPACEITPSTYNKSMNASTKAHGISGSLKQSKGDQLNCVSDGLPSKEDCIRNTEELVGAVNNTLNKNNGVSAVSSPTCRYLCCSDCLCSIYDSVKKILIREKDASASCWTVEDVHDVVASCSVNLLSAVRDLFTFASVDKNLTDENTGKSCACQDVVQSTESPHQKSSVSLVPFKCSFHSGNSVSDKTNACTNSLTGLGLKFIFRDNIMVTSEVDKDVLFHCKSESMCLGPLVECITMIKHPLD